MCDGGGGSGSGSPEDENPLNRRIADVSSSSEDDGRPQMVRQSVISNSEELYYGPGEGRNVVARERLNDTTEELEDCNCNVGRLRQAVSSNFQMEREIRFAEGALAGLRESCQELNVPPDHPSITNLQSAYDAVQSPDSCWNRHGTSYHERALARFREPQDFAQQQGRLSEAINQVQPQFGPEASSLIRWQEANVPSLEHVPPRVRAHERGVRDAICREHAEPFLDASAQSQAAVEGAGYGRYPQNIAALGAVQQRVGSMAQDDPMLQRYLPVLSDMQSLHRQRNAVLDEQEAEVCSACIRQLDPNYPGYTPVEERELNREILADPRRCERNNEIIPALVQPHLDRPPPRRGQGQGRCADLNETVELHSGTLSDEVLTRRHETDHRGRWFSHTPYPPSVGSYTIGEDTFETHYPDCACARYGDSSAGSEAEASPGPSGSQNAEEVEAAAAAAAADEAAAAQEAAIAAEAALAAAQEASDQRLIAIRAQHRAERQAGPVAASRDFNFPPTTRPDTPRRPRTRAAQRARAAAAQCGAAPAPAAAPEPEAAAGMEEALMAEQVAAAAATDARLRCLRAKRLADKVARATEGSRKSERIKRKRVADTGVEESGCPPGCACAACVADKNNQQGPAKRPPRRGDGGAGGCGGAAGQGVSA